METKLVDISFKKIIIILLLFLLIGYLIAGDTEPSHKKKHGKKNKVKNKGKSKKNKWSDITADV